jgi:hypothetical protein
MLDPEQLRIFVVRPTLEALDLWSQAAENLVIGTAAQESHLTYIDQKEPAGRRPRIGPGLGLWQMEAATHDDIWHNWLTAKPAIGVRVLRSPASGRRPPRHFPSIPACWFTICATAPPCAGSTTGGDLSRCQRPTTWLGWRTTGSATTTPAQARGALSNSLPITGGS